MDRLVSMTRTDAASWLLPRGLIVMLWLAATTITVTGLRAASDLIGPVFLALVLTIAVHPVRGLAMRRGLPAWVGTLAGMVTVYVLLLGLAASLVVSLARFATLLPAYQDDLDHLVDGVRRQLDSLGVGDDQIGSIFSDFDLGRLAGYLTEVLTGLVGVMSNLAFIVTLLLFMALDASGFPDRLRNTEVTRAPLVGALIGFAAGTRRYLVVCTVFGLIVAAVDVVVLWLLDIPAPLLWGLLAFITNYIPNIGFLIGLVPPAVLALLDGGPDLMVAVIVAYAVINVIIQSVIQPRVVGEAVGLSGTLTFLSLVFWAWVLGPVGALLAVPLSLLTKALLVDIDPSASWVRPLLSGGGPIPDGDDSEGETVTEDQLSGEDR